MDPRFFKPQRDAARQLEGTMFDDQERKVHAVPQGLSKQHMESSVKQKRNDPTFRPRLHKHIETSAETETRWAPTWGTQCQIVLAFLRDNGPHTRREIAEATGIVISTVCPIVVTLREKKLVVESDGKCGRDHEKRNGGFLLRAVA